MFLSRVLSTRASLIGENVPWGTEEPSTALFSSYRVQMHYFLFHLSKINISSLLKKEENWNDFLDRTGKTKTLRSVK